MLLCSSFEVYSKTKGMVFSIFHHSLHVERCLKLIPILHKYRQNATRRACCARFAMIFRFLPGIIKRGSFGPPHRFSVRNFYKVDTAASRPGPGISPAQSQPPDDHKIHAFHVAHTRKSVCTHKSRLTKWPSGWSVFLQVFDIEINICQPASLEAG